MGKNNKARRAAKARQRARQRAQGPTGQRRGPDSWRDGEHPGVHDPVFTDAECAEIAWLGAAQVGIGRTANQQTAFDQLRRLPRRVVLPVAERLLREHISLLWEHGWQPRELHRHARVAGCSTPASRLTELAVTVDARRLLASGVELHPDWRAQVEELATGLTGGPDGWLGRWESAWGDGPETAYAVIAEVIASLFGLPGLDVLIPPPGHRVVPGARRSAAADPMLERVRSLLAKAESTEFEAEAIALTAKAQELITRHAIDAALLSAEVHDTGEGPTLIRVPVDPPYADAKSLLLQTVAAASRCRAVYVARLSLSNVVGLPDDLAAVEILFTSLLVQAQHALAEAGRNARAGSQTRSQSFRSAFLLAYANRIGERLEEINQHVFSAAGQESASFLPVLRSQEEAVADFMTERFGDTYTAAVRGGYSPAGWSSGRLAADQARLTAGHLDAPT